MVQLNFNLNFQSLGSDVQTANKYINNLLECGDNRLIAQTPQEISASGKFKNSTINDNHILCCCLQWQEHFQNQGKN